MRVDGFKNDMGPCIDQSKVSVCLHKKTPNWTGLILKDLALTCIYESIQIKLGQFSIV